MLVRPDVKDALAVTEGVRVDVEELHELRRAAKQAAYDTNPYGLRPHELPKPDADIFRRAHREGRAAEEFLRHTTYDTVQPWYDTNATGRLIPKTPNIMAVPATVRACFRAEPGRELYGVGVSALEAAVLALRSGDETLARVTAPPVTGDLSRPWKRRAAEDLFDDDSDTVSHYAKLALMTMLYTSEANPYALSNRILRAVAQPDDRCDAIKDLTRRDPERYAPLYVARRLHALYPDAVAYLNKRTERPLSMVAMIQTAAAAVHHRIVVAAAATPWLTPGLWCGDQMVVHIAPDNTDTMTALARNVADEVNRTLPGLPAAVVVVDEPFSRRRASSVVAGERL